MGDYNPPFTITNSMLSYVAAISEKIGRITIISDMETKPHLRKNNRIRSIHSSLKIEANSLSVEQVRDVINGKLVLGELKEIQEVKNAYDAYERISEINPYSIADLKRFHGIMTKYIVDESGGFRHGEEGVFNGEKCIFMAPPAQLVPQLMIQLFDWMKRVQGDCGILLYYQNGKQYLNIFLLKVRLKNFRTIIIMRLQSAMSMASLLFLLNLCYLRLIRY